MRVKIYRCLKPNLKKRRVYSILHKGRVVAQHDGERHVPLILLSPKFAVSEAGRQRVLREKRKNVHAAIVGVAGFNVHPRVGTAWVEVTYNPYAAPTFTVVGTGLPVRHAMAAKLEGGKVYAHLPA